MVCFKTVFYEIKNEKKTQPPIKNVFYGFLFFNSKNAQNIAILNFVALKMHSAFKTSFSLNIIMDGLPKYLRR